MTVVTMLKQSRGCVRRRRLRLWWWLPSEKKLVLLLLVVLLLLSSTTISAQRRKRRELEQRLEHLTDEELEALCTERGFEVITDELDQETGRPVVSTHQDYVDAAWQCLQMEDFVVSDLYSKVAVEHEKRLQQQQVMSMEEQLPINPLEEMQHIAGEDYIPLPKPIKRLLGLLFVRVVKDVVNVMQFFRRQLDSIIGILRDGITGTNPAQMQQQQQHHQRGGHRRVVVPTKAAPHRQDETMDRQSQQPHLNNNRQPFNRQQPRKHPPPQKQRIEGNPFVKEL